MGSVAALMKDAIAIAFGNRSLARVMVTYDQYFGLRTDLNVLFLDFGGLSCEKTQERTPVLLRLPCLLQELFLLFENLLVLVSLLAQSFYFLYVDLLDVGHARVPNGLGFWPTGCICKLELPVKMVIADRVGGYQVHGHCVPRCLVPSEVEVGVGRLFLSTGRESTRLYFELGPKYIEG